MDRKEKLQNYLKRQKDEELLRRRIVDEEGNLMLEAVQKVASDLRVELVLQEVRDELWGEGSIVGSSFNGRDGVVFSLVSTSWPKFIEKDYRYEQDDDGGHYPVEIPAGVGQDKRELGIKIQPYKIPLKGQYYSDPNEPWDKRGVRVGFLSTNFEANRYDFMVDVIEPLGDEEREKFDEAVNVFCANISKDYPLVLVRKAAREEIIQKVLSGDLKRMVVPKDFGYNFPPEPPEVVVSAPRKKKGLFGF